jgi:hypothetical protein
MSRFSILHKTLSEICAGKLGDMHFEGEFMSIPNISMLNEYSKDLYFCDSFSKKIKYNNLTSIEVCLEIATQMPAWIEFLMSMRNWIVSKLGLKDLGG